MQPGSRRGFLRTGFFSFFVGLLTGQGGAQQSQSSGEGEVLKKHMRQGNPATQPLDTMVLFERGDDNNGRAMTHEVLSLIHEEKGKNSYPWTLYASLDTHHVSGDGCVVCSRLHKRGTGWSAGLHSEVFSHAPGVALGANIEMSNDYTGSTLR